MHRPRPSVTAPLLRSISCALASFALCASPAFPAPAAPPASPPAELRWGGDAEGGAPFVEADPADPTFILTVRGAGYKLMV